MAVTHLIECKNCGASTNAVHGQNVHDTLNCGCCGDDHKHAGEDGSTVVTPCRNVTISVNAVAVLTPGGSD